MTLLHCLSYKAPILLGKMHQAVLLHPTLRTLAISPNTYCETPCKLATMQRGPNEPLHRLFIVKFSPFKLIVGLTPPFIGARTCSLPPNILITHSLSLRTLRVPILLLYDALRAVAVLPEFPHLHSLSITPYFPLVNLEHLYSDITETTELFLTRVHSTIRFLDWR